MLAKQIHKRGIHNEQYPVHQDTANDCHAQIRNFTSTVLLRHAVHVRKTSWRGTKAMAGHACAHDRSIIIFATDGKYKEVNIQQSDDKTYDKNNNHGNRKID